MSIDDCNGCRSEDCDACVTRRQHAKHKHCLDCRTCLDDASTSDHDGDRCKKCVPCRQECSCDSEYAHELAEDEFRVRYAGSDAVQPMSAEEWHRIKALRQ